MLAQQVQQLGAGLGPFAGGHAVHHGVAHGAVAAQGMVALLDLPVGIELPPVGLITLRGQRMTPVTAALVECLRDEARLLAQ